MYSVPVRCSVSGGAQLHGDHLTTGLVSPELDGAPQFLVVGGGRVPLDVDLEPLVVPGDEVPVLDLPCGPYPLGGARGRGVLEGQLHPGVDGVFGIQGSGFLFGPALRLGPWLWRGFGLCGGLALLRTLAAPGSGLSPLGRCALGPLYGCVARCKHRVFAGGWDVGLGVGLGPNSHLCHANRRVLSGFQEEEWNRSCVCVGERSCAQTLWAGDRSSPWRMMSQGVKGAAVGGGGSVDPYFAYSSERS